MSTQKRRINTRSQFIGAMILLLFFAMIYRFYELQVVDAAFYEEKAEKMYNTQQTLKAKRGTIFDRNGKTIAKESSSYTVVAITSKSARNRVNDPIQTAEALAPLINMSATDIQRLLSQDRYQVELRPGGWKVDRETMLAIQRLELPGITFIEEAKRYYPNQDFAAHVIGFINRDNEAIMGLEHYLNGELEGHDGQIQFKRDNRNNRLPQGLESIDQPENGKDIYLTLDERIQMYVEQALDFAQEQYEPEKMTVIVSRPQTGEILAMSSRPSFNPNQYTSITNYVNHAITSTFEPGSTFKIVTLAAAIEEGLYNGEEFYESGSYKVPGGRINDHQRGGWGRISFLEGVQKSSNVAFTILGYERMPKEVFYDYIYRFGFGEVTGIDLPQEKKGYVKPPATAYPLDVATMTFGQGVAVTAIQQIAAINAIANGGKLMKPYIVDRIVDPETGTVIQQHTPEIIHEQVVSERTTEQVADILETVVTEGTGKNFYIDGYAVAGKTGTAQKVGNDGRYIQGKYIHSFIGFAPKENPEFVVYVAVDAPQVEHYSLGGSVVAEIFKHVMRNSLQYLSIKPNVEEVTIQQHEVELRKVNSYTQQSLMSARQKAEDDGFDVLVIGNGTEVIKQVPQAGAELLVNERVYLITSTDTETTVPDLTGMTLRTAQDWAAIAGITLHVSGRGYVTSQSYQPDSTIQIGDTMSIVLQPKFISAEEIQDFEGGSVEGNQEETVQEQLEEQADVEIEEQLDFE